MSRKRKDIVYLISSSLNLGGAEIQCVELANRLEQEGFEVRFYSLKYDNILKSKISSNIQLREFKIYSTQTKEKTTLGTLYWWLMATLQLRKEMRVDLRNNKKISIISFMFHSWLTSFVSSLFLKNVKNIISVRNSKMASRGNKTKIFRLISYIIIGNLSKYVVFNSQFSFKALGKYIIKNNKLVIKNLIVESQEKLDKNIEYKILNSKSQYNIVSVGRLDKLKNYTQSIYGIHKLIEQDFDVTFFIFGTGAEYLNLKELSVKLKIEDKIVFMDRVPEPYLYFHHFDLLLQTSKHESFPNSIVEALNQNLFVMSTNVGDVKLLLNEKRGLLLESDNKDVIVQSLISHLKENHQNLTDSRKFIQEFLNNEDTVSDWLKLIYS
jgi:glycosyltransferase involved in cell wall biosynthesis|tara:strand:- start:5564 stop:6706 length:1143 start_codon:yes stop_codon:yes gene_type:complete